MHHDLTWLLPILYFVPYFIVAFLPNWRVLLVFALVLAVSATLFLNSLRGTGFSMLLIGGIGVVLITGATGGVLACAARLGLRQTALPRWVRAVPVIILMGFGLFCLWLMAVYR